MHRPIQTMALLAAGALLAGSHLAAQSADRIEVGQEAPDFTLESSNGSSHQLSSLRGDKKALLVFYRGTW